MNGIQRHGFQTLISSVKTIAPISAEKAEAERLLTVIAVISGPASRMMPMTMSWTTPARRPCAVLIPLERRESAKSRMLSAQQWALRQHPPPPFRQPHAFTVVDVTGGTDQPSLLSPYNTLSPRKSWPALVSLCQ